MDPDLLAKILGEKCAGLPSAGLAAATDVDDRTFSTWLPSRGAEEPQFLAYSITKVFTATLLMQCHERGVLELRGHASASPRRLSGADSSSRLARAGPTPT